MKTVRKPSWLKIKIPGGEKYTELKKIVEDNHLNTICASGRCPNMGECWSRGAATLMILGEICTRSCKFCATQTGKPFPIDPNEPEMVAKSVKLMRLKHAVITSVDRDELEDKGAQHWADVINAIKNQNPCTIIEVLLPDFDANPELIDIVIKSKPNILSHNIETVRRLTPEIRSRAKYDVSLKTLQLFSKSGIETKSGIMVGLGETQEEVIETLQDLYHVGCRMITIGQYLQPTPQNIEVVEYIHPDIFDFYKGKALEIGFKIAESGPLVRSSYMAEDAFKNNQNE
ncbi:MAG: lipoyl synthase [Bacteroidota bacterium]|jgi:lipoic acid synthetase